ncbi:MAG: hypothetical protein ACE5H0_10240 [Bacteroidota bacterium]
MSTRACALYLPAILLLLTACAGSKEDRAGGIIQGRIYVTGNEPFARLAVEDANGEVYLLSCSKKVQEELLKLQGMPVRLYCSQILRGENQNSATVERFERLETER